MEVVRVKAARVAAGETKTPDPAKAMDPVVVKVAVEVVVRAADAKTGISD